MAHKHIQTKHPLKMPFGEYLRRMTADEQKSRLGEELFEAYSNGKLDASSFIPPQKHTKYNVDSLKHNDIALFSNSEKQD